VTAAPVGAAAVTSSTSTVDPDLIATAVLRSCDTRRAVIPVPWWMSA
jgi:hypothetical protein